MDDYYVDKMQRYENLCLAWIQKADQEYLNNGLKHSKQECAYLQQAVAMRSEMARISIGEEQQYHRRKAQELNIRIAEIIRIIDPEYMKRKAQEARNKGKNQSKSLSGADKNQKSSIDSDEVKSWFKEIPSISFADVTGMNELKKKLQDCITDARLVNIREYLGIRKQKAYFFIGPPGCGKTYIAQAFVHELVNKEYKYLSLVGSDILSKYVGDAEKTITRLFEEAEKNAPCIVFIDEIDGVCKNRSLPNLPEYAASITTAFLTGYNRIHASEKPIIFIGATNYPAQVDSAMLDRVELINVPFPDKEARIMKFRKELENKLVLTGGLTYEDMGIATEENIYNYRDIERLCEQIKLMVMNYVLRIYGSEQEAIKALKIGEYGINRELFDEAQKKYKPTPKETIIKELQQWEEQYQAMQDVYGNSRWKR